MIKTQPKTQQQHRNVMKPAFTLLEILTVIAIIAVLASLTIGGMGYYDDKMKYSRTEILIASIEQALEDYKADNGSYPRMAGNLRQHSTSFTMHLISVMEHQRATLTTSEPSF